MTFKSRPGIAGSLIAALCAGAIAYGSPAHAEYPEKPVTIIVAWAAGGATDSVARAVQPALVEALGADIVVKNIPGAAGTIGTAQAAAAEPDGYTVLISPAGPVTTQPHLRKIPYDLDSFDPIGRLTIAEMLMMVPKDSAYESLEDIIAQAKANPGKVKFASTGAGTLPHISILALDSMAGIESKHVPFKGSANVMKALLGNVVDVFSDQAQLVAKYDLRPLAVWSAERMELYPDVPTMKELGYDYQIANWVGMFVPKGTPAAVKDKLEGALAQALKAESTTKNFSNLKLVAAFQNQADFGKFSKEVFVQNGEHLAQAGLIAADK